MLEPTAIPNPSVEAVQPAAAQIATQEAEATPEPTLAAQSALATSTEPLRFNPTPEVIVEHVKRANILGLFSLLDDKISVKYRPQQAQKLAETITLYGGINNYIQAIEAAIQHLPRSNFITALTLDYSRQLIQKENIECIQSQKPFRPESKLNLLSLNEYYIAAIVLIHSIEDKPTESENREQNLQKTFAGILAKITIKILSENSNPQANNPQTFRDFEQFTAYLRSNFKNTELMVIVNRCDQTIKQHRSAISLASTTAQTAERQPAKRARHKKGEEAAQPRPLPPIRPRHKHRPHFFQQQPPQPVVTASSPAAVFTVTTQPHSCPLELSSINPYDAYSSIATAPSLYPPLYPRGYDNIYTHAPTHLAAPSFPQTQGFQYLSDPSNLYPVGLSQFPLMPVEILSVPPAVHPFAPTLFAAPPAASIMVMSVIPGQPSAPTVYGGSNFFSNPPPSQQPPGNLPMLPYFGVINSW